MDLMVEEFKRIHPEDLWVYNKLQLSLLLGYNCGPIGISVPKSGWYIIRPCINFLGMGRNARKIFLNPLDDTEKYGMPGEFWCEFFSGEHISVDFYKRRQVLTVLGTPGENKSSTEMSRWDKWEKVERFVQFPKILDKVWRKYDTINVEYIGGRPIEVHFRRNPDFDWGNSEAIPVWKEELIRAPAGYRYQEAPDYDRLGFYIR